MQLVLFLGNDFIAGVIIDEQQLSRPGYLGQLKRKMREEHRHQLQESSFQPEFLIVQLPVVDR